VADLLIKNGASLEVLAEPCLGKSDGDNNFFDAIRALATTNNKIGERFDEDRLSILEALVDSYYLFGDLEEAEQDTHIDTNEIEVELSDFDFNKELRQHPYEIKEEYVMPLCELIKMHKILPHYGFIVKELRNEGLTLDNKTCWFYAQNIQWAGQGELWNLFIDHDGFHSSMGGGTFKLLFNWDDVAEIKTSIEEDHSEMTIGLFQEDGEYLTLTQSGSLSLLIVYWLYQKIVCDIIENFKGQPAISWTYVDEKLGVQRLAFDSYEQLYEIFPDELIE
jgi:hypothetical protein